MKEKDMSKRHVTRREMRARLSQDVGNDDDGGGGPWTSVGMSGEKIYGIALVNLLNSCRLYFVMFFNLHVIYIYKFIHLENHEVNQARSSASLVDHILPLLKPGSACRRARIRNGPHLSLLLPAHTCIQLCTIVQHAASIVT